MGSVLTLLRISSDEAHAKKLVARCLAGCSRYPIPLTMRRIYVEVVGEPADGLSVEKADLTEFEPGPPRAKGAF